MRNKRTVLVITRGNLKRSVLQTPLFQNLKEHFPKAYLMCFAEGKGGDVFQGNPFIDELHKVPLNYLKKRGDFAKYFNLVKKKGADFAVAIDATLWDAILLKKAKALVVGPAKRIYSWMFDYQVFLKDESGDNDTHYVEIILDYLREAGIQPKNKKLCFPLLDEDFAVVEDILNKRGIKKRDLVIGFHITKEIPTTFIKWPVDKFASLARSLMGFFKAKIFFTGMQEDVEVIEGVMDSLEGDFYSLAGKLSLKQMGCFIKRCDLFISVESYPLFISSALGIPCVGLYAMKVDNPKRFAPWGVDHEIIRVNPTCQRCNPLRCRYCQCYEAISEEELVKRAAKLLARKNSQEKV